MLNWIDRLRSIPVSECRSNCGRLTNQWEAPGRAEGLPWLASFWYIIPSVWYKSACAVGSTPRLAACRTPRSIRLTTGKSAAGPASLSPLKEIQHETLNTLCTGGLCQPVFRALASPIANRICQPCKQRSPTVLPVARSSKNDRYHGSGVRFRLAATPGSGNDCNGASPRGDFADHVVKMPAESKVTPLGPYNCATGSGRAVSRSGGGRGIRTSSPY